MRDTEEKVRRLFTITAIQYFSGLLLMFLALSNHTQGWWAIVFLMGLCLIGGGWVTELLMLCEKDTD